MNASKRDHILIEHIREAAAIYISDIAVAITTQADMQGLKECCRLILPTTGKPLNH